LLEGRIEESTVSYSFETVQKGKFLFELHRFPTLNSVGRIRVGVSVDDREMQILESYANDERKGNWKSNVQNNVDKLYMELPELEAGIHKIELTVIDKYFSFSRFVIYTQPRKENNLGYLGENQTLPEEIDIMDFALGFYGEEAVNLKPRKVLYLSGRHFGDTLVMDDICIQPDNYGEKVQPKQLLEKGKYLLNEDMGKIFIELSSAMVESRFAYTSNYKWQYCTAPSYAETGLAMYIRQRGLKFKEENAPALNYKLKVTGGRYTIWVRTFSWGNDEAHFTLGFDNKIIPEKELYNGKRYWCYANENVWKWIPIYEIDLSCGEHLFSIYALSSALRLEQAYITKGNELPPIMP